MTPHYDLVCTECGAKIIKDFPMPDDIKAAFGAGYCNRCPEQAKLEWKKSA